ncbi:hypothetical protein MASR2M12_04310 [Bacteroidales bacterium]
MTVIREKKTGFIGYMRKAFLLLANPVALVVAVLFAMSALAGLVNPAESDLFALAGLFFPLLFLFMLLIVVLLVLLHSKWIWLHLALLLASLPVAMRYPGNPFPRQSGGLVAASYNVHGFRGFSHTKKTDVQQQISAYLKKSAADFACIQEFRSWTGDIQADIKWFTEASGFSDHYFVGYWKRGGVQSDGYLLLSKFPILSGGTIPSDTRRQIGAFIDVMPRKDLLLRVATVHLISFSLDKQEIDAFGDAAALEMDLIKKHGRNLWEKLSNSFKTRSIEIVDFRKFVKESPHPLLVCGDFNDTPASFTYNNIVSTGLNDSHLKAGFWLGSTYAGKLPWLRIDYCFGSNEIRFRRSDVNKLSFSDHYPVKVHFEFDHQ